MSVANPSMFDFDAATALGFATLTTSLRTTLSHQGNLAVCAAADKFHMALNTTLVRHRLAGRAAVACGEVGKLDDCAACEPDTELP